MTNPPTISLPPGQANNLTRLLDSLDGVTISASERASLTWLAGQERPTVANIAAVMNRARTARPTTLDRDAPHRLGQRTVPIR